MEAAYPVLAPKMGRVNKNVCELNWIMCVLLIYFKSYHVMGHRSFRSASLALVLTL